MTVEAIVSHLRDESLKTHLHMYTNSIESVRERVGIHATLQLSTNIAMDGEKVRKASRHTVEMDWVSGTLR